MSTKIKNDNSILIVAAILLSKNLPHPHEWSLEELKSENMRDDMVKAILLAKEMAALEPTVTHDSEIQRKQKSQKRMKQEIDAGLAKWKSRQTISA